MKDLLKIITLTLIISQGCGQPKSEINEFSSSMDTLIISTYKQKGSGLFSLGVSPGHFKDTTESFAYPVIYPMGIKNVMRGQIMSDFDSEEKHYVDIIKGNLSDDNVLIIDENNNNNLTDDSIRIYKPIDWNTEDDLISINYTITKGKLPVADSSWLRIGELYNDIWLGKSEHRVGDFSIDKNEFQIGVATPRTGDFTYDFLPVLALISQNTSVKDSLGEGDKLALGEILKLHETYYRFDTITHFGELITLVKISNFHELIGTQVGMLAPSFSCVTVSGDTLNSDDLNDRVLIIANSCGCGGDKISTEAYYDIREEYSDKIHILRLDSRIDETSEGNHIDMENEYNKDIYNKYRKAYCSRTCYVIDKQNRITDKFPIKNWKQYLPQILE